MPLSQMSHRERVEAALAGQEVDRVPVSLWRHFPNQDQSAEALAAVTLDWQRRFAFDFIKLMPPGDYGTIDWGGESEYQGSTSGTRQTTRFPIERVDDWRHIGPVAIDRGMNREVVQAAELVNDELRGEVPILQTIFSPLTIAMKLSNGQAIEHLRQAPDLLHAALAAITEVTRQMTHATLDHGASGIFFASQCASTNLMTVEEYREFGKPYDLEVLEAAEASQFTLVHLHGENIMFDEVLDYPAQAFNWHDRHTEPSLAEGEKRSSRCVVGGINEAAIDTISPQDAAAQARDAIEQLEGRHVMIAPGCVVPITTPEANARAIIDAVRAWS